MKPAVKKTAAALFWVAVWYLAAFAVGNSLLVPYPHRIIVRLAELAVTGSFWLTSLLSLARITLGIICGIIIGMVCGFATARWKTADAVLSPALNAIKAAPVASFIILLLLWAGRDFVPGIVAAIMVAPIVWSNISEGLKNIDPLLTEMAQSYGISGLKKLKLLTIPSLMPYFTSAVKTGIGNGWKSGIAAEVLTVPVYSIGKMIYESKLYLNTEDLFAWTLFVVILSSIIEKTASRLFLKGGRTHE